MILNDPYPIEDILPTLRSPVTAPSKLMGPELVSRLRLSSTPPLAAGMPPVRSCKNELVEDQESIREFDNEVPTIGFATRLTRLTE